MKQFARIPLWLVCLFCLLSTTQHVTQADDGTREVAKGDLIRLQGKWVLVDFARYTNGLRETPTEFRGELQFTANRYHLKLKIDELEVDNFYTIRLFPGTNPTAFEVTMPSGQIVEGIFEIKGATLRRCYSQPGEPRPDKFQAGNQTYQVWRRAKPRLPAAS